jgi:hypothetical protein
VVVGVPGKSLVSTTLSLHKAPYSFIKQIQGAGASMQNILLSRAGPEEGSERVDLAKINFHDADNSNLVTADFDPELQADQDASVLVSHVMGRGHDQALVVKSTPDDRTTEAIYGHQTGSSDIVCVRLH